MAYIAGLLDEIGIGGQRVRMFNLSSAEGARFAALCGEMTEAVRALGPNPLAATAARPRGKTAGPPGRQAEETP